MKKSRKHYLNPKKITSLALSALVLSSASSSFVASAMNYNPPIQQAIPVKENAILFKNLVTVEDCLAYVQYKIENPDRVYIYAEDNEKAARYHAINDLFNNLTCAIFRAEGKANQLENLKGFFGNKLDINPGLDVQQAHQNLFNLFQMPEFRECILNIDINMLNGFEKNDFMQQQALLFGRLIAEQGFQLTQQEVNKSPNLQKGLQSSMLQLFKTENAEDLILAQSIFELLLNANFFTLHHIDNELRNFICSIHEAQQVEENSQIFLNQIIESIKNNPDKTSGLSIALASNYKIGRQKILTPKFQNLTHELEQAFVAQTQYYVDLEDHPETKQYELQKNDLNIQKFIEARIANNIIIDIQFANQLKKLLLKPIENRYNQIQFDEILKTLSQLNTSLTESENPLNVLNIPELQQIAFECIQCPNAQYYNGQPLVKAIKLKLDIIKLQQTFNPLANEFTELDNQKVELIQLFNINNQSLQSKVLEFEYLHEINDQKDQKIQAFIQNFNHEFQNFEQQFFNLTTAEDLNTHQLDQLICDFSNFKNKYEPEILNLEQQVIPNKLIENQALKISGIQLENLIRSYLFVKSTLQ